MFVRAEGAPGANTVLLGVDSVPIGAIIACV